MKISIQNPCTENFDAMTKNGQKSFCNSCEKNVHDLTKMSKDEVFDYIEAHKSNSICARIKAQYVTPNLASWRIPLAYAFAGFGFVQMLSCSDVKALVDDNEHTRIASDDSSKVSTVIADSVDTDTVFSDIAIMGDIVIPEYLKAEEEENNLEDSTEVHSPDEPVIMGTIAVPPPPQKEEENPNEKEE